MRESTTFTSRPFRRIKSCAVLNDTVKKDHLFNYRITITLTAGFGLLAQRWYRAWRVVAHGLDGFYGRRARRREMIT